MQHPMPPDYLKLAARRADEPYDGYLQPEDFGYDFRDWICPYTKGAHAIGSIAVVLQDWGGSEDFAGKLHASRETVGIAELGRDPSFKTNKRLETLLRHFFDCSIADVYATNVFPFIKEGKRSAPIPDEDLERSAEEFTVKELEIARPEKVLALGRKPQNALTAVGFHDFIALPHPAAGLNDDDAHLCRWQKLLS